MFCTPARSCAWSPRLLAEIGQRATLAFQRLDQRRHLLLDLGWVDGRGFFASTASSLFAD